MTLSFSTEQVFSVCLAGPLSLCGYAHQLKDLFRKAAAPQGAGRLVRLTARSSRWRL